MDKDSVEEMAVGEAIETAVADDATTSEETWTADAAYGATLRALFAITKRIESAGLLLDVEVELKRARVLEDIHRVQLNQAAHRRSENDCADLKRHRADVIATYRDGFAAIVETIRAAGKL